MGSVNFATEFYVAAVQIEVGFPRNDAAGSAKVRQVFRARDEQSDDSAADELCRFGKFFTRFSKLQLPGVCVGAFLDQCQNAGVQVVEPLQHFVLHLVELVNQRFRLRRIAHHGGTLEVGGGADATNSERRPQRIAASAGGLEAGRMSIGTTDRDNRNAEISRYRFTECIGPAVMSESPEISSSVGTRLLFENDAVRVWDLRLGPGESTPQHCHELDYLYVVIGDGKIQRVDPDGTANPPKEMADGEVHFRKVEDQSVHAARNAGESVWRNIVVELKK